jgi:hypothetical protein
MLLGLVLTGAAEPLRLGPHRQLFLDDRVVASSEGLRRTWHAARKHPHNPVMTREKPWEGKGPYVYGSVHHDGLGQFKLWYNCYVGGRPDYWVCYATSRDGLHWERPALDAVADPRLPHGHNVVMLGGGLPDFRQGLSPSVLRRPDEHDASRRYTMTYWDVDAKRALRYVGLCTAFSPDGIHWTNVPNNPVFPGASDVTDASYDPTHKRYLLHYKTWRVDGKVVGKDNVSYWTTWDTKTLPGGKVRFTGPSVDFAATDPQAKTTVVDFDREPESRRVMARAESSDLVHWHRARLVFELPEPGDPPGLSTYGMTVFPYEGLYLGLLRIFHDEREIDLHLAVSRDDLSWKRVSPGTPFIGRGPGNSVDAGMVFSTAPVEVGGELWFYYGAFTGHHGVADKDQSICLCLATLRRDGFVSLDAGREPGELVTLPFRCEGNRLLLNFDSTNGELRAEVRDEGGRPIDGFGFSDCPAHSRDTLNGEMRWNNDRDLAALQGRTIRLAIRLRQARLFAFQVAGAAPARP